VAGEGRIVSLEHPDPEGHLTDITITELVKLRDAQLRIIKNGYGLESPGPYYTRIVAEATVKALDAILEPWGEATIPND
jgi:hypothetical protein